MPNANSALPSSVHPTATDAALPIQLLLVKKASGEISDVFNGEEKKGRKADLQKEGNPHPNREAGRPSSQHPGKGVHMRWMALKREFSDICELLKNEQILRRRKSENGWCGGSKLAKVEPEKLSPLLVVDN